MSTGHANSPQDIISRIETMVLQGQDFPLNAIRQQIASGIDIIVQLGRLRDKSRRVLEVSEVDGFMDGEIVLHTLYRFEESGVYAMLRRLERKTGIKASPHMLRHYFANARRKDGWKLEMISQALGHRNIETTMKYLNITEDELIEVSDAFYNRHQAMYGVQNLL